MNTPEVENDQNELTGSYTFDQLSERAQQRALDTTRDWNIDDGWWDCVYEDAVHMASLMGIKIDTDSRRTRNNSSAKYPRIYFSGFWSQGDGASFSGSYACRPNAVKDITMERDDPILIAIAEELTALQVSATFEFGYPFVCSITTGSQNSHSGTMDISNVELDGCDDGAAKRWSARTTWDLDNDALDALDLFRRFADWIYAQLKTEYEYLTSDAIIKEVLVERLFDADGDII